MSVIGISTGVATPFLTTRVVKATLGQLERYGAGPGEFVELSEASLRLGGAPRRCDLDADGEALLRRIEAADVIVVGTPIFRGDCAGTFKRILDLIDRSLLGDKLVLLCASLGFHIHELMLERQSRPRFDFFDEVTVAATIYGTGADFSESGAIGPALRSRIACVAQVVAGLVGEPRPTIASESRAL